ncbi:uncharacterized protein LOC109856222 [Pseudomyrmex gracilis]|uniref:uncharacterized protein LOC109856222 n=1 Tax=Pseudomyrmex gracilis TaxID=219809 RepID=UPI000995671A|nr:uncharacterized protein LOC109856222 [Pseudomyrmex gracilis]
MKYRKFEVIKWPYKIRCSKTKHQTSFWMFLLLIVCSQQTYSLLYDNATENFVQKCQMECNLRKDFPSCGKYKIVRWLNTLVNEKEFNYGPFRIIKIPPMHKQSFLPVLPHSRAFRNGITETLDFIRNSIEDLVTKRAIAYTINNSATARDFSPGLMLMDEDELEQLEDKKEEGDWRIFKKKKSIILPILILLNLIKLKLLILPIFLGVHFIKKLLVLGSLILPSVLAHLKICKVQQPHAYAHKNTHPFHLWSSAAEAPADYPSGYDEESNWHRSDYQMGYPVYHIFHNPYG